MKVTFDQTTEYPENVKRICPFCKHWAFLEINNDFKDFCKCYPDLPTKYVIECSFYEEKPKPEDTNDDYMPF